MNRTDSHTAASRWLKAEQEESAEAEEMLLELFQSLPYRAPSAGFADRVLERVALPEEPAAAARESWFLWLFRSPGLRLALASCLLAAVLSLLWLPQTLRVLAGILSAGDLVQLSVGSLVDLGRWLGVAVRLGEWSVTVLGALAVSLMSPAAIKVAVGCLVVSAISFVALRDLMTRDRSLRYVESNR